YNLSPLEIQKAIQSANITLPGGDFSRADKSKRAEAGLVLRCADDASALVVGVFQDRPVFLKDVAKVQDGPAEVTSYLRHGWGRARGFAAHRGSPSTLVGETDKAVSGNLSESVGEAVPAVTIAIAKKKGTNAVTVAQTIHDRAEKLCAEILPDDVEMVITRNYGLTANEKVNDL